VLREKERLMKKDLVDRLISGPTDRRRFMKRVGATGIGVAAATMLGGSLGTIQAASTITDADILNFALNLEYLEAEFYSMATFGATLQQLGILSASQVSGSTTGGEMVNFNGSPRVFGHCFASRRTNARDFLAEHAGFGGSKEAHHQP
jgi:hypothetical protein